MCWSWESQERDSPKTECLSYRINSRTTSHLSSHHPYWSLFRRKEMAGSTTKIRRDQLSTIVIKDQLTTTATSGTLCKPRKWSVSVHRTTREPSRHREMRVPRNTISIFMKSRRNRNLARTVQMSQWERPPMLPLASPRPTLTMLAALHRKSKWVKCFHILPCSSVVLQAKKAMVWRGKKIIRRAKSKQHPPI